MADPAAHADLLAVAHDDARLILARDPDLNRRAARRCGCCSICSGATKPCAICARDKGIAWNRINAMRW